MPEQENHFTVFIRLPFKRGDFVDPPPVAWSATKERELWDVISRQSKGNEIDWHALAEQFQVSQQFLLQQAAWLYERQLSQVRAQMRRMGTRQSATASPALSSTAASIMGTQAPKRPATLTSRGQSRLSTQMPTTASPADVSAPNTPARSKTSLSLKSAVPAGAAASSRAHATTSRPLSRKSSRDNDTSSRTHSRRGSVQHQLTKSPGDLRSADLSSSDEGEAGSKLIHRRPTQASTQRRTAAIRKSQHTRGSSLTAHQLQEEREEEEDDDEDGPAFLPFGDTADPAPSDPSATLRGVLNQPTATKTTMSNRPSLQRNRTSERVRPSPATTAGTSTTTTKTKDQHPPQSQAQAQPQAHTRPPPQSQPQRNLASSTSSLSSNNSSNPFTSIPKRAVLTASPSQALPQTHSQSPSHRAALAAAGAPTLPTPLSPRQQAALAAAAGLSPRRRAANHPQSHGQGHAHTHSHGYTGSESSPSMGSSFSDLDDASVTQSALEEALMSNMNALGGTVGGGTTGGLGSRVSGISQALRSRYFDARGTVSGGTGAGQTQQGQSHVRAAGNIGNARGDAGAGTGAAGGAGGAGGAGAEYGESER